MIDNLKSCSMDQGDVTLLHIDDMSLDSKNWKDSDSISSLQVHSKFVVEFIQIGST
jgi:hypothetical protein